MTTTPRIGAPLLALDQAAPETTVNAQATLFDAFAGAHFKDRDLTAPPGSPAQGDCYLVAASPTGAWSGQAGKIAIYINTSWTFITAKEGFLFWVDDENILILYDGAAWNTVGLSTGTFLLAANNLSDVANAATAAHNLGLGTADSPQFTGVNLGHASDTTLTRTGAGDIAVEGNAVYRAGGTDVPVADGGTGSSTASGARTNLGLLRLIAFFFTTAPTSSEVLGIYAAADDFTIAANMSGTQVSVGTNPTATFAIDVQKNGSTIGTISIATSGAVTLTTTSGTTKSISSGDIIKFVAPSSTDATIANVAVNIKGTL